MCFVYKLAAILESSNSYGIFLEVKTSNDPFFTRFGGDKAKECRQYIQVSANELHLLKVLIKRNIDQRSNYSHRGELVRPCSHPPTCSLANPPPFLA